jgi:O-antigen/teichoic acid export membrane protein
MLTNSKKYTNYIITYSVEFLIMAIGIALFKLVNMRLNDVGFSEFTINKRLIGFLMPLLMIGMGVAIPKFASSEEKKVKIEIYYIALIIISISFALFLLLSVCLSATFSTLVFGDSVHAKMFITVALYVYALLIHSCIYNYFRSNFNFTNAAIVQLINLGVWPIIVLFFVNTLLEYFLVLALITLITLILTHLLFVPFIKTDIRCIKNRFSQIFNYGLRRVPGDVLLGFFFALPVFIISSNFSMKEAGMVAFCLSLFNIVIALTSPIGILVLPMAAKMSDENNYDQINKLRNKLLLLAILLGLLAMGGVMILGTEMLLLFDIKDILQTKMYLVIVFAGVFGYSIFSLLRSIVDASNAKAQVGNFIIIAFVCFVLLVIGLQFLSILSVKNILISFAFSMNILGILTLNSLYWKRKNKT